MANGVGEILPNTVQEIFCLLLIINRRYERKSIDEHPHRIPHLQVAAPVGCRRNGYRIFTDVSAEGEIGCAEVYCRRRQTGMPGKFPHSGNIRRYGDTPFRMGEVFPKDIGDQLRGLFHFRHPGCKKLFHLGADVFLGYKVIIGIGLLFGLRPVQRLAELAEEQIHGGAVTDKMVHIHKQIQRIRADDLKPHCRTLFKIKRTHEFLFTGFKLFRGQLPVRNFQREAGDWLLNDLIVLVRYKMAENVRMGIDHPADGGLQLLRAYPFGESQNKGNVILHRIRIGLNLRIDTLLCKAEPAGLYFRLLLCNVCGNGFRILLIPHQQAGENFVFNALDTAF